MSRSIPDEQLCCLSCVVECKSSFHTGWHWGHRSDLKSDISFPPPSYNTPINIKFFLKVDLCSNHHTARTWYTELSFAMLLHWERNGMLNVSKQDKTKRLLSYCPVPCFTHSLTSFPSSTSQWRFLPLLIPSWCWRQQCSGTLIHLLISVFSCILQQQVE